MNILFATSEAVPFAKTGGLADVCGALPIELSRLGHKVTVILPAYRQTRACGQPIATTDVEFTVPIGVKQVNGRLLQSHLPDSDVVVFLVENDDYFDRDGLYGDDDDDYMDNCERFVFFCRGVMETIRLLPLSLDVIHCNDWPTGLVPAYLKTEYRGVPGYEQIGSLFSIHNLGYQGTFWHWDMLLTGLDWKYFNWKQMEFYGNLNLMKTGLVFADKITTVSPRYAEEIQTAEQGCGLEGVLQHRRKHLRGIINGVDYRRWDPGSDPHIEANYTAEAPQPGKGTCKASLQAEMGLPQNAGVPLVGFIGRLADQKGIDLVAKVLPEWAESADVQWVLLGKGDAKYHELFEALARRYPQKVAARLTFCDTLAHRIEAGADMFLMPSRYEPCGLNQLYSLRYGTIPVVRATGGLADTVVDANDDTISAGTATGFQFREYHAAALAEALRRACEAFTDPKVWQRLIATAMHVDWSWNRSAKQYVKIYEELHQLTHGQLSQAVQS